MPGIKKRGYYFSIEATMGILILATSFLMVVYFTESAVPIPDYRYARNIAGYLSSITLGEICEADGCEGYKIGQLGLENYTLINVIGSQYSKSPDNITDIAEEIFMKSDLSLRGREVFLIIMGIGCDIIYSTQNMTSSECSQELNETTSVVYRKVINGYDLNPETGEISFWGDYLFEVMVWQQ